MSDQVENGADTENRFRALPYKPDLHTSSFLTRRSQELGLSFFWQILIDYCSEGFMARGNLRQEFKKCLKSGKLERLN